MNEWPYINNISIFLAFNRASNLWLQIIDILHNQLCRLYVCRLEMRIKIQQKMPNWRLFDIFMSNLKMYRVMTVDHLRANLLVVE